MTAAARTAIAIAAMAFVGVFWVTSKPLVAAAVAVLTGLFVLVGGQAPDIDANSSIPRRRFNRLVQILVIVGVSLGVYFGHARLLAFTAWWADQFDIVMTTSYLLGIAVGVTIVVGVAAVPSLIQRLMPPHRGVVHSIPFWAAVAVALALLFDTVFRQFGVPLPVRVTIEASLVGGMLVGAGVHITMDDEIASFLDSH